MIALLEAFRNLKGSAILCIVETVFYLSSSGLFISTVLLCFIFVIRDKVEDGEGGRVIRIYYGMVGGS